MAIPNKLNHKIVHYSYRAPDGSLVGTFRLKFEDSILYWDCVHGPEEMLTMLAKETPTYSIINDDITLFSFTTQTGADVIAIDLAQMTVSAHVIGQDDANGPTIMALTGTVDCIGDDSKCAPPDLTKPISKAEE